MEMAATMTPTKPPPPSATAAVSSPTTAISTHTQTVHICETILHRALLESNRIAKVDLPITLNENDVEMTHQIATAKMLNYCIRMLHADGWHPPTILRAMALRESGLERGIRGTMFQALRERRKELEVFRLKKTVAREAKTGSGGDTNSGHGQTTYNSRSSPKSSQSSHGDGGRGGNISERQAGRNGHGVGGISVRGRHARGRGGHHNSHVHNCARGMMHLHTNLRPQHHSLIGAAPGIEFANDNAAISDNKHPQAHSVIADGAVSRDISMNQMGGNGQPVSLI